MHADYCHHYGWTYSCKCGAAAVVEHERTPIEDPGSLIWMAHEDGDACERCDELKAGADARSSIIVYDAKGEIERKETRMRKQGELDG